MSRAEKKYRKWIKTKPCLVCGNNSEAHHYRTSTNAGMGMKPTDYYCLPLCRDCHSRLHEVGEKSYWWNIAVIDPFPVMIRFLSEYIEEQEFKTVPF